MSSIDPSLYEAARVDGASRWRQTFHVMLPGIMTTLVKARSHDIATESG
ncbi:ABC transporter permease subunit [Paenibacillus chungangensis]|uniref:ABC transporter permease subunit n=1 Tax=Paenibacillus chungangensis TaxID=696535 RepID=A0ABW3HW38_9BACL